MTDRLIGGLALVLAAVLFIVGIVNAFTGQPNIGLIQIGIAAIIGLLASALGLLGILIKR